MIILLSPAYQLGPRKKQADSAIQPIPNPSGFPSIVLEVGSSESLSQLKIDAALWLEHSPEVIAISFLYCYLLTGFSDTASNPFINWPSHSSQPKSAKNHNPTVARLSSQSSYTLSCSSSKGRPMGLGSWLDTRCNCTLLAIFWYLQRTSTCRLWCPWSCAFEYYSLATAYCWFILKMYFLLYVGCMSTYNKVLITMFH